MKKIPTCGQLINPSNDDNGQSKEFSIGEKILHKSGPSHIPAIDKCQETCTHEKGVNYFSHKTRSQFHSLRVKFPQQFHLTMDTYTVLGSKMGNPIMHN